jgi:GWxTD domain-containing protein
VKTAALGASLLVLSLLHPSECRAQSPAEQFQKLKGEIAARSWTQALATIATLQSEAGRPGNEESGAKLEAPLAFYRGVCEANLGHADEAAESFVSFLRVQPGSTIDATKYSKATVAAFERARNRVSDSLSSLARAYEEFRMPPDAAERDRVDARWASGPVQWILTADEKASWSGLSDPNARLAFVEGFWKTRALLPGAAGRTYRQEFERRVAFSDAYLAHDEEKRGSLTDRGMVFVLLGPPTRAARRTLRPEGHEDEENEAEAIHTKVASGGSAATGRISGPATSLTWAADRGPENRTLPSESDLLEIWTYGSDRLPRDLPYLHVDVHYVTKKGYGKSVMQREADAVNTLRAAAKQAGPAAP